MVTDTSNKNGILRVIGIQPFFLLWSAQIISQVAFNMLIFIVGVFIYAKTRSNASVSLIFLTVGVPAAFFGIVSGAIVDNFEKRRVLLWSTSIRVLLVLGIFFFRHHV